MSEAKRFYWLKLKHDFFCKNKYVKKLRKMENGTELAFLYLELLTYSLEEDGQLFFDGVEESLAEELALDLDEDPELMTTLIDFLLKYGLLRQQDDDSFLLIEVAENTGSETKNAEYNRIRRANEKKVNKVTEGGNNVTKSGNNVTECYTYDSQCSLEKREKRKELRDKELEVVVVNGINLQEPQEEPPQPHNENVENFFSYQQIQQVVDLYHEKCPSLPKVIELTADCKQRIKALLEKYTLEQITEVFEKAESSARLRGECNGKGYEGWIAKFNYLIDPKKFAEILKWRYPRGQPRDSGTEYAAIESQILDN